MFVTPAVFSSVGEEMLAGGSVVVGWDPIERTGPKDDRQVTVGSERWSKKKIWRNNIARMKNLYPRQ